MPIIPTIKCKNLHASVAVYTKILDFVRAEEFSTIDDPGFCALSREGSWIYLSSHNGDGVVGQAIAVIVSDVEALFRSFLARGLIIANHDNSPVHQGPTEQTWGNREFYVNDPDGNTLRFIQLAQNSIV